MPTLLEKLTAAVAAGKPGRLALKRGEILRYELLVDLRNGREEPTVTAVDFDHKHRTFYRSEIAAVYGEAQPREGDAPVWGRFM